MSSRLVRLVTAVLVVVLIVSALPTAASAQEVSGEAVGDASEVDVRVVARRLDDGRVEFGLQQRGGDGSWGGRLLPSRRFFPRDATVGRWLVSSRLVLSVGSTNFEDPGTEVDVRVVARRLERGRVEFGLQQRGGDGSWGGRLLPSRRFFPRDATVGRWLVSSRLVLSVGSTTSGSSETPQEPPPEEATPSPEPAGQTATSTTFARQDRPRGEDTLIAANGDTTCAVIPDGGISCWGSDGLQHRLTAAGLHDVVAVSLSDRKFGNNSTVICVLHGDGTVSCWGDGHDGRLGHGDENGSVLARRVPGLEDVVAIAAGGGHTCVLHAAGGVSCWGDGEWGQMGDGTDATRRSPLRVPGVEDVVAIAAGYARTCGVHSDGTVTCWGRWGSGGYSAVPAKLAGLQDVVSLAAGVYHLCAVHSDGRVSCSRYDSIGRETRPSAVRGIDDAVAVSVGEGTFCTLHRAGGVSCWGRNHEGQVGNGTKADAPRPVRLRDIDDAVAITVSGPNRREEVHACALREDGGAYCWGNNGYEQLGTGDREDRLVPTQVAAIEEGRLIVDPLPTTPVGFLETFTELVVAVEEDEFPWLRTAWESLRGKVDFTEMGTFGGFSQHYCQMRGDVYECEPLAVRFSTRFGVDKDIIAHEFAHAYDADTAATPTRAWGAVQLYFNVTYKDCFPDIESIGGEFLADTMSHLIEPSGWLTYYESTAHAENRCARYTPEPTEQDEEVVLAGLAGVVPDWYTENITNGAELWAAFLSRPGDKLLANIMHEFGGLCSTRWIRHPLDPSLFPAEGTNPFREGGC